MRHVPLSLKFATLYGEAVVTPGVIDILLEALERNYVFPDMAATVAVHVREQQAQGKYDELHADELARLLTADLQIISNDKHLYVQTRAEYGALLARLRAGFPKQTMDGIRATVLAGGIGYLHVALFCDAKESTRELPQLMHPLSEAAAVVVDLRDCVGGDPAMVALVASYFFGPEPVHLNSIYWRPEDRVEEFWTSPGAVAERFEKKAVYILTSKHTASGGEEFAYDLQAQQRATIVGERTAGAAHPGDVHAVGDELVVFVAHGRAVNPITGTNWEGVGVAPDVVIPAPEALEVAIERALRWT